MPLKDSALEIVVEGDPRHATPGIEGSDMAAQEILHVGAEVETQEDLSGVGKDGDEGHQWPACFADFKMAEVSPVHLHLFTRQGAQAQECFALGTGSMAGDEMPEVIRASGVATILDHDVESRGAQAGKLFERFENEG